MKNEPQIISATLTRNNGVYSTSRVRMGAPTPWLRLYVLDYAFLSTITEKADGTVIYADRCSISEDKLAKMGVTFKKIPRDISRL